MIKLLWTRPEEIAKLVASKFDFIDSFGPCYAVGFIDIEKMYCCGGGVLALRGGNFDGEITFYLEDGYSFSRANLKELFNFAFNHLGLVRITCFVARPDKATRRVVERAGFRYEGCMRLAYDGKKHACIYGMLKEECKWISKGKVNGKQPATGTNAA